MNILPFFSSTREQTRCGRIAAIIRKLLCLASRLIMPFAILYLALSIFLKIMQQSGMGERIPLLVGAVLFALASVSLSFRSLLKGGARSAPLAYWGLLAMGFCVQIIAPGTPFDRHETLLSIMIPAAAAGLLISVLRYWALLVIVPYLSLLALTVYISFAYGIDVDSHLMAQIVGASPQDVAQFATLQNILCVILLVVGMTATAFFPVKWGLTEQKTVLGCTCGAILVACILISHAGLFIPLSASANSGIGSVSTVYRWFRAFELAKIKNSVFLRKVSILPSPAEQPSRISTLRGGEGVILVLHIGESVRCDRLSINGYERDTTPGLKACPRLINFRNCTAVSSSTTGSTMAILTNARGNMEMAPSRELEATTGCVMDLFAANSFECYGFFTSVEYDRNEACGAVFESLLGMYTAKAKKVYEVGAKNNFMPKAQLPQIDEALSDGNGNKFLLINNMGSHTPFSFYNRETPAFSPASASAFAAPSPGDSEAEQLIQNAYDNTLVYTDEYIRDLVTRLAGKPFLYCYISDHGEPLGDDGKWFRANVGNAFHKTKWSKVPFFFIYSPEFEALHPHFREALSNLRSNSGIPVAHENVFHTLLGIFGIETSYYEASHDLSSPSPVPYQGPSCDREGKALDGLRWE